MNERTASRSFRSKFPGRCPLGADGAHTIRVGDLIVKVTPGYRWRELAISRRMKSYYGVCHAEYVHAECQERYTNEIENPQVDEKLLDEAAQ